MMADDKEVKPEMKFWKGQVLEMNDEFHTR